LLFVLSPFLLLLLLLLEQHVDLLHLHDKFVLIGARLLEEASGSLNDLSSLLVVSG